MAILRVTVEQLYRQQQVINRYYYIASGTPASASLPVGLYLGGFATAGTNSTTFPPFTLLSSVTSMQTDLLEYISVTIDDLYDLDDFYSTPYPSGTRGTIDASNIEDLGPTAALGFRTQRITRRIRRGQKRFAGMTQEDFTGGGFLTSGGINRAEAIAQYLGANITYNDEGNTLTYVPAILKLEEYTTPSGNKAYKKFEDEAVQLENSYTGFSWEFYPTIRTQRSRQYGRGS